MTELSLNNLHAAANRLIEELGKLASDKEALQIQRLEQCARALNVQLKAIQELEAHKLRQSQAETGQTYTRYEDLPPLTLEERDRFKQDLIANLAPR